MKRAITVLIVLLSFITISLQAADTLKIAYYESPPFVMETEDGLEGISVWLWENIQREEEIPYTLVNLPLNETLDALKKGTADMSINPLTITSQRSESIDFSTPFYIASSTVMINKVSGIQKALQFGRSFFSLNFLRAIFALFVVILVFGFLAWLFERRKNPEEFKPGIKGLWSGIWWSAVTMTTVGYGDKAPKSTGGRIIGLIWMFAAIIIISGFTASIASSLTVNQLSWNQNNIQDFKEKTVATVSNSATAKHLERNFFKDIQTHQNLHACLEALRQGDADAVAYDRPLLSYIHKQDSIDSFALLPIDFNEQIYAFGFSKTIPKSTQDAISVQLLKTTESTDWKVLLNEYALINE